MLSRVEEGGRSKLSVTLMSSVVTNQSEAPIETSLTGQLLLDNPLLNKGSAFSRMSDVSLAFWDCFHCILPLLKSNSLAPTRTGLQITQKESA